MMMYLSGSRMYSNALPSTRSLISFGIKGRREIRSRVTDAYILVKKLHLFFYHSDCPVRWKLHVFNAIVRSKLMYGLESLQIVDSLLYKLDVFQLKGLRQILHITTTYMQSSEADVMKFSKSFNKIIFC